MSGRIPPKEKDRTAPGVLSFPVVEATVNPESQKGRRGSSERELRGRREAKKREDRLTLPSSVEERINRRLDLAHRNRESSLVGDASSGVSFGARRSEKGGEETSLLNDLYGGGGSRRNGSEGEEGGEEDGRKHLFLRRVSGVERVWVRWERKRGGQGKRKRERGKEREVVVVDGSKRGSSHLSLFYSNPAHRAYMEGGEPRFDFGESSRPGKAREVETKDKNEKWEGEKHDREAVSPSLRVSNDGPDPFWLYILGRSVSLARVKGMEE